MIPAQDSTKAIHPRRRRGERLYVTLTTTEKAAIMQAADIAWQSASEWARVILMKEAKRATRLASKAASVSDEAPGHLP
jgi:hypothetical protein